MKKLSLIILIVVVGFIGFKGYVYYNNTYRATTAYAIVPKRIPEKTEAVDMSGDKIKENDGSPTYSYDYSFDFIKANGKKQTQGYTMSSAKPTPYTPGTFIRAEISNKRVVKGPYVVDENKIPKDILEKLKK